MTRRSISAAHDLRQLGARRDAQFGESVVHVGFHGVGGEVELGGDVAVGRALGDEVDDLEFRVGEAVPTRFCPWVVDDAPFHAQPAQRAAYPAGIGGRPALDVGVERRVQLVNRVSVALCTTSSPPASSAALA